MIAPDFSVVTPAFNEERYLGATSDAIVASRDRLRRLRGQTVGIIVVDNGSVDRTAAIARKAGVVSLEREESRGRMQARLLPRLAMAAR